VKAKLEITMKKCCNKYLVPKIYYRASIIDSIGLMVFLGFILLIASFFAWFISGWLVSIAEDGDLGKRNSYGGREGSAAIVLLYVIYKVLPKIINACSYLVDYKLKITSTCKVCNTECTLADYPKTNDPF
jgi:hypothetical protein